MDLSYSQIALYKKCPKSWYQKYILKEQGDQDYRVFLEGTTVHKMNEYFLRSDSRNLEDTILQGSRIFNEEVRKNGIKFDAHENVAEIYAKIVKSWIQLFRKEREIGVLDDPNFKVEWAFHIPIGQTGWRIVGFSDLIYNPENHVDVLDFKTTDSVAYLDELQLKIYDWAYTLRKKVKPRRAGFVVIKANSIVWYDITEEDHSKLEKYLVDLVTEIGDKLSKDDKGESFQTKPEFMKCKYCAFRKTCIDSAFTEQKAIPGGTLAI